MTQGRRTRPIFLLFSVFGLMPALFIFLVFLPVRKRMAADQARLEAAIQRNRELPNIQPLTSRERALLEDPAAPWRTRIPLVSTDAQRLAHYHRVVTDLQKTFKERKIVLSGIRSTWNPIKGSYTLPSSLGSMGSALPADSGSGAGRLEAWVLEAQVNGSPGDVFKALETVPGINPILEPVALRWEQEPRKQMIVLRNLVTIP